MSEFKVNAITNRDGSYGPQVCGITTFGSSGMTLPSGPTSFRGGRGRGVFASGFSGAAPSPGNLVDTMDYVEIATLGNAIDFGDMAYSAYQQGSASSSIRGVTLGGANPSGGLSTMQYVTISSNGGGYDFGDLTDQTTHPASASNNTRGIVGGGYNPTPIYWDKIEFFTIATTGSSVEFGNLTDGRWYAGGGRASATRMLFLGGTNVDASNNPASHNVIEFIEIASGGQAQDFGDLVDGLSGYGMGCGNCQSPTRTVTMGAFYGPADRNEIQFVNFATKGNATDFGDLLSTLRGGGANSNLTRGILGGGRTPTQVNTIQFITFTTTGDSVDFGDLTAIRAFNCAGMSDNHGGLVQ